MIDYRIRFIAGNWISNNLTITERVVEMKFPLFNILCLEKKKNNRISFSKFPLIAPREFSLLIPR